MVFSTYAYSGLGDRKNNEDYFLYRKGIWVVADGLGGHDCGEEASKTASEAVVEFVEKNGISLEEQALHQIIMRANESVIDGQKKDESFESMRTTLVFAVSDGKQLRYANVGDSRFYYFKQGKLHKQSEDHSVSALSAKLGDIKYEDIRHDADRNKLLKVLGNAEELKVKIPEAVIPVESGDAFLLCSDGFWENVYENEMEIDLAKSDYAEQWLKFMLKRVMLRTQNQKNDNYTAIAVVIE